MLIIYSLRSRRRSLFFCFSSFVAAYAWLATTPQAHAQFTAAGWNVKTLSIAPSPLPESVVDGLADDGFHYRAENYDRHVVSQLFSSALELAAPGDRVTLSFDLQVHSASPDGDNNDQRRGVDALRYWLVDTTQESNYVNGDSTAAAGGGKDGFAFGVRERIYGGNTHNGRERVMYVATNVGSTTGLGGSTDILTGNATGSGEGLRANTGNDTSDVNRIIGYDVTQTHRLEMTVTLMSQGLFVLESDVINLDNLDDQGNPTRWAGGANERLVSHLWRDPLDDSLGFNGFAFTVNNRGGGNIPFDMTVSNLQVQKTNIGAPGVAENGAFHVSFTGRQDFSNDPGNGNFIEQDGENDSFTWAPFILQGNAARPAEGFIDPFMEYANVFGEGKNLKITVDVPKVEHNGSFSAPTQSRLGINHLSIDSPNRVATGVGSDTGTITLDLPEGTYEVTSFHHIRHSPALTDDWPRADVSVGDAGGSRVVAEDFFASLPNSEHTEIGQLTFSVTSNGIDPVVLTYVNVTESADPAVINRDFPINGLVIAPSTGGSEYAADFDGDGDVDGDDLTHPTLGWKARFGADLDGSDFLTWQREFGSGVPSSTGAAAAVPEPATAILLSGAMLALLGLRRTTVRKIAD